MRGKLDPLVMRLSKEAERYPILTQERERTIANAWHKHQDRAALDELVGSHVRLVVKIARGFAGYGLPLSDLVAEGNIGLIQAAKKFDPDRGFRFATYAMWWIRAAIQEYILHSWSLVKIGTNMAQKKLFFNLRRLKAKLKESDQGDLAPETVTAIAKNLDVPEAEVVEMNRRMSGRDNSLNSIISEETDSEWLDLLPDSRPSQETIIGDLEEDRRRRALLRGALMKLGPRERDILVERHLKEEPATVERLSQRHSVSRERIRQIETRAIAKIAAAMPTVPKERLRIAETWPF